MAGIDDHQDIDNSIETLRNIAGDERNANAAQYATNHIDSIAAPCLKIR